MKKQTWMQLGLAVLLFSFMQACGGGGDSTPSQASQNPSNGSGDPPVVNAAPTPALHFAYQAPKTFVLRPGDGTTESASIVVTFSNVSSNGVVTAALPLSYNQPQYPMLLPVNKGYNHVDVRYQASDTPADATFFIPEGSTVRGQSVSYVAASDKAAMPNVLPLIGTTMLVLEAPAGGDYSPYIVVRYEKADGTQEFNFWFKPSLPMTIPLKSGFVKVGISSGNKAADGTYAPGQERVWEYGDAAPSNSSTTIPTKKPLGDVVLPI